MSTIHLSQAAGPAGKFFRTEPRQPLPPSSSERHEEHSDQDMMYAWSIGVTSAARNAMPKPRREECPPEVYIG